MPLDHEIGTYEYLHISYQDYMYLIEQYALYVSDDRFVFDQYTGEPVFIGNIMNEPRKPNTDGQEERRSDTQTDDDDDEESDSDDDWHGDLL